MIKTCARREKGGREEEGKKDEYASSNSKHTHARHSAIPPSLSFTLPSFLSFALRPYLHVEVFVDIADDAVGVMRVVPSGNGANKLEEIKGADTLEDDKLGSKKVALADVVGVVAPSRKVPAEGSRPLA